MLFIKSKFSDVILTVCVLIMSSPLWAALPMPPDGDMAANGKSWLDVGKNQMNKALSISAVILGGVILLGVASGTLRAYHVAHEKQDLGHFFKMLLVGLLMAAIGLGLAYAGLQVTV